MRLTSTLPGDVPAIDVTGAVSTEPFRSPVGPPAPRPTGTWQHAAPSSRHSRCSPFWSAAACSWRSGWRLPGNVGSTSTWSFELRGRFGSAKTRTPSPTNGAGTTTFRHCWPSCLSPWPKARRNKPRPERSRSSLPWRSGMPSACSLWSREFTSWPGRWSLSHPTSHSGPTAGIVPTPRLCRASPDTLVLRRLWPLLRLARWHNLSKLTSNARNFRPLAEPTCRRCPATAWRWS